MDVGQQERIKARMRAEFERTGPPQGFPPFPDIPAGRYTSPEFFALEQAHVWPRVWVLAGRVEDAPDPGDFFTLDDLGVPVVVVRGHDGTLRAFYNTCQHRGAPVVRDARGSARTLRCQYHSWTYDIDDGSLVAVPDERDFVDLDRTTRCLESLRCEAWGGWVFVNRDPEALPLLDWLGPVASELAQLNGPSLREIGRESVVVPCNWKVTAEALSHQVTPGFATLMEEDTANMAPIQRSLESPALSGVPLNCQERRIWHLHEELERMIGPDRVPADLRIPLLLEP